jgi:hypothetical protein
VYLTGEILEEYVAQCHRTSVWCESVLPVLVHITSVEGGLGSEIFKGDVSDVSGASGIGLDECYVVALYYGNISCML